MDNLLRLDFPSDFKWGVGISALQTEGFSSLVHRGNTIWDDFALRRKIKDKSSPAFACSFFEHYENDLDLVHWMKLQHFKTSISWARILPGGSGQINGEGLGFYDRLTDAMLERNIEPWYVLYHWDLPSALQDKGGWINRDTVYHFLEFCSICADKLGDRVKNWVVMNEPFVFTGAGYFLGVHAPGLRGMRNFLPTVHHVNLANGLGIQMLKENASFNVGTALSFASIHPATESLKDFAAANRLHALVNLLFLDPMLGKDYPQELKFLSGLDKFIKTYDMHSMHVKPDFLGVQIYTREIVKHNAFVPYIKASIISAQKRNMPVTNLGQEVYPNAVVEILTWLNKYLKGKTIPLIVTETGISCDEGQMKNFDDTYRIRYYKEVFKSIRPLATDGSIAGIFLWSLLDNFEWAEGYTSPFGLFHVNFETMIRTPKKSAYWVREGFSEAGQFALKVKPPTVYSKATQKT